MSGQRVLMALEEGEHWQVLVQKQASEGDEIMAATRVSSRRSSAALTVYCKRAFPLLNDGRIPMEISARNQLQGTVKTVTLGTVMAEVVVDIGGGEIVAAITRGSAEHLNLQAGDAVTVIIKATEVLIGK